MVLKKQSRFFIIPAFVVIALYSALWAIPNTNKNRPLHAEASSIGTENDFQKILSSENLNMNTKYSMFRNIKLRIAYLSTLFDE